MAWWHNVLLPHFSSFLWFSNREDSSDFLFVPTQILIVNQAGWSEGRIYDLKTTLNRMNQSTIEWEGPRMTALMSWVESWGFSERTESISITIHQARETETERNNLQRDVQRKGRTESNKKIYSLSTLSITATTLARNCIKVGWQSIGATRRVALQLRRTWWEERCR